MRWFDAHNHLQDRRLGPEPERWIPVAAGAGVAGMGVHGTCEADWPAVRALALGRPSVIPSFGLHPWRVSARSPAWREVLAGFLDSTPHAGLGEVGLDRWILDQTPERCLELGTGPGGPAPLEVQVSVLREQLDLASERGLPVTLHCLRAWGPLMDCLRGRPRLPRGFLLHSYGGSAELVPEWVRLGGYFSVSGDSLHPRKASHAAVLRSIPRDRLLIETDAPDQLPPPEWVSHPAVDDRGRPVNAPANLPRIAVGLAGLLGVSLEELSARCEANWMRFFGAGGAGFVGLTAPAGSAGAASAAPATDPEGSCSDRR
jgi:TatD DNase family protein